MRYFITWEGSATTGVQPTAQRFELPDAVAQACRLIDEGKSNVAIRDDAGKSIGGDELIACCLGDKEINADLVAVAVDPHA